MPQKPLPSFIDPTFLYTWKGFQIASGISSTRIHQARRAGIVLPTLEVGRRKFVRGRDAIEYIERLAAQTAAGDSNGDAL
jgi:hypothetical protein